MPSVDRRVVQMEFDNQRFEQNIETSILSLDRLKDGLNLEDATKGFEDLGDVSSKFSLNNIAENVQTISERFTTMGILGVTALQNIANRAVYAGEQLIKSFTIDPIKTGFQEYETQINAIQTILSNTKSKGETIETVNAALDELNRYADMTIYNFTEMTKNIGTFSAAGVDLDTSVASIKGIANLAAISGSTSYQASNAMYQLSQALAAGTVKLMDWNSVVNAGMGGQVFQDALTETARVHGVAIDEMLADAGSFRNTLEKGWLTSDILTETLQKFTGDLTEEQLRQMGYTEEQITKIVEMGRDANDAATKVKTLSQLLDTLKEAAQSGWGQTWRTIVGDYEEARELFTRLSDIFSDLIGKSAESRNTMLSSWAELGGRTSGIEALFNILDAIGNILGPISQAFGKLFPPTTGEQLFNMTKAFEGFTGKLKDFTERNSDKVYAAFEGIFSVVRLGVDLFLGLADAAFDLVSGLSPLGDILLAIAGDLGEFLTNLTSIGRESGEFTGFQFVGEVLTNTLNNIRDAAAEVSPVLAGLGDAIAEVFNALTDSISRAIQGMNLEQLLSILSTGLIGFIAFENVSGVLDTMDSVRDTLEAWQWTLRADALIGIAGSLVLLTAALIGLASIDTNKLAGSMTALTVLFVELFGSMALFGKNQTTLASLLNIADLAGAMVTMSIAITILAGAVKLLSTIPWEDTISSIFAVTALIGGLTGAMILLTNQNGKAHAGAIALIALATAVRILTSALKSITELDQGLILNGLMTIGVILAEVAAFQTYTAGNKGIIGAAVGLNLVATSMVIFSKAVEALGSLSPETIAKGLLAMAIALGEVAFATRLMPDNMIVVGIGVIAVANAMVVLSQALSNMGGMSIEQIGKSFLSLFSSLSVLTIAMMGMSKALPGAAALLTISAALAIFTPAFRALGELPIGATITALLSLAAVFGVLGVAATVLTPVVPTILAVSGAIGLLGVGVAGVSIGIAGLATALTALAASGVALGTGVVAILTGLASTIPMIFTQIGNGIVAFVTVIGESGTAIATAFTSILGSLFDAGITLVPKFVELATTLITSFLQGLSQNAGPIADAGIGLVIGLISAIGSRVDDIILAGFEFVANFISGIGNGLAEGIPMITSSVGDLVTGIISGFVEGIFAGIGSVVKGVVELGSKALNALADFLGIHSPSVEFQKMGRYAAEGFALGLSGENSAITNAIANLANSTVLKLESYKPQFQNAGSKLFAGTIDGIKSQTTNLITVIKNLCIRSVSTLESYETSSYNAGRYLAIGFADGIEDYAYVVVAAARSMALKAYKEAMAALNAHSPSRLFMEVGSYVSQGFAIGIGSEESAVLAASKGMVNTAISSTKDAIARISDYLDSNIDSTPVIRPVMDLSNVESGARSISAMMSRSNAVAANSSFGNQNGEIVNGSAASGGAVYQFTQNNYSPKALSRVEIYRQTKNQFATLKGTV